MPMKNFSQQIYLNFAMDVRVSFVPSAVRVLCSSKVVIRKGFSRNWCDAVIVTNYKNDVISLWLDERIVNRRGLWDLFARLALV